MHEHLENTNEPLYFHQFIERAQLHGLQYLAESEFATMLASGFAPQVAETVRRVAPDVIRQEQLMDFLRNRSFRQTLMVHAARRIERHITPDRVQLLWVAGLTHPHRKVPDLRLGAIEKFSTSNGATITTSNSITKAALVVLAERWPQSLSFSDLLSAAHNRIHALAAQGPAAQDKQTLANDLLQGYANGLVELHSAAAPFGSRAGRRGRADRSRIYGMKCCTRHLPCARCCRCSTVRAPAKPSSLRPLAWTQRNWKKRWRRWRDARCWWGSVDEA